MTPKRQRMLFIAISSLFLCSSVLLILNAFKENIVFFYTPTELTEGKAAGKAMVRIGGLVKQGSVSRNSRSSVEFMITDEVKSVLVHYSGMLPNLFREGQGVVAEGHMNTDGVFIASRILAKHDETYMPPEVAEALKRAGKWKGATTKP